MSIGTGEDVRGQKVTQSCDATAQAQGWALESEQVPREFHTAAERDQLHLIVQASLYYRIHLGTWISKLERVSAMSGALSDLSTSPLARADGHRHQ